MKIQAVIENTSLRKDILNEHGLSMYIEFNDKKFMFDLGSTDKFLYNAEKLGIDIKDIDYVVLSHGHYDHTGGLKAFCEANDKAEIYMKSYGINNHYVDNDGELKYIGINMKAVDDNRNRIHFVDRDMEIVKGMSIINNITNYHEGYCRDLRLKSISEGHEMDDAFKDELILVIEEKDGITIFTGCSHNGIINMIKTVQSVFKGKSIKRVIGGFHLIGDYSPEEIEKFGDKLFKCGVEKFYTCHCTGFKNYEIIKNLNSNGIVYISSGEIISK